MNGWMMEWMEEGTAFGWIEVQLDGCIMNKRVLQTNPNLVFLSKLDSRIKNRDSSVYISQL